MPNELNLHMAGDIQDLFDSGELYKRIEDGSFKRIQLGSQFKKEWDDRVITFIVAGFDLYNLDRHHLVIVPDRMIGMSYMNKTMTTETGYYNSFMNREVIGPVATSGGDNTVNQKLYNIFGEHLLTTKECLSVDNQGNFEYFDCQAVLMSEYEVFGENKYSLVGNIDEKEQMPLFKLSPEYMSIGYCWWLRDMVSSTNFCDCVGNGGLYCCCASLPGGVRPRFVIG